MSVDRRRNGASSSQNLGTRDNDKRLRTIVPRGEREVQRLDIVAIEIGYPPAEGAPFVGQRLERGHRVYRAVDLLIVGVDHDRQSAQAPVCGEHRRLLHLSFFHLAVAEKSERVAVLAGKL